MAQFLLACLPSLHLSSIRVFYFLEYPYIPLLHHLTHILSSFGLALNCHFLQTAFLTLIPESGSRASITYLTSSSLHSTSHTMFFLSIYFSAPPSERRGRSEQVPSLPQSAWRLGTSAWTQLMLSHYLMDGMGGGKVRSRGTNFSSIASS